MKDRGWKVVTIDIRPELSPDIVTDIRDFSWTGKKPDLLWASPPCIEFSREDMPWHKTGKTPDLSLTQATVRIVAECEPRFWILENVRGARRWLKPLLGKPRGHIGSRYLWGKFPLFRCRPVFGKWRLPPSSNRSLLRSKIPYELSLAVAKSIEQNLSQ